MPLAQWLPAMTAYGIGVAVVGGTPIKYATIANHVNTVLRVANSEGGGVGMAMKYDLAARQKWENRTMLQIAEFDVQKEVRRIDSDLLPSVCLVIVKTTMKPHAALCVYRRSA